MAKKKNKPLSDEAIAALLEAVISEGVGYQDSQLAKERETVQKYYDGKLPLPSHKGNSKYVSNDVFDKVEGMKAMILETFAAGTRIGTFDPQSSEDVEPCRIATDFCDYVMFRQNDGYGVFNDVIHDGLMFRIGVVKTWWDKNVEEIEEEFENIPEEELIALTDDDDVTLDTLEGHNDTGLFSGSITRKVAKSQVKFKCLPSEEFGVEPQASCLDDAVCWHKQRKSHSDLLKEGYAPSEIDKIGDDADGWQTDIEALARFEAIGADRIGGTADLQEATKKVWVHEVYADLDVEGTGKTKLWKITKAGGVILDKEQVRKRPFRVFAPLRRPHSVYGTNWAHKMIPTQNSRTVLVRGILDHTVHTNNPRYTVLKGGLSSPNELMDNRVGGIVNINRPDSVKPLEQSNLNPFVFQTIGLLDFDAEESSGVSQLSQGLNKDAVSKQNSQALVENLTSLSMQRQKIIARNFAEQIVKPLFLDIYELVLENEDRYCLYEVAGNWVEVDPTTWEERKDFTISLKLGYGENEKETAKWLEMDTILDSNPKTSPLYTIEKKHAVLKNAFLAKGIKDIDTYLERPEKAQPPQPDPLAVKQLEIEDKKAEAAVMQAKAALIKIEMAKADADQNRELAAAKLQADHALKADKLDIETREIDLKEHVAIEELDIMRKAAEVRAIASPSA